MGLRTIAGLAALSATVVLGGWSVVSHFTGVSPDLEAFAAAIETSDADTTGDLKQDRAPVLQIAAAAILDTALLEEGPTYEGRIRAVLDLNTAPDALGWLLFWTEDWSKVSDWATWTLRP